MFIECGRAIITNMLADIVVMQLFAVRVCMVFEQLGPMFVKLGQIMSIWPDLIPVEWAVEFKKLQNIVPGVLFDVVCKLLEEEFLGEVDARFNWIEEVPIAVGSMAQVHRAKLVGGVEVVLKILWPGII